MKKMLSKFLMLMVHMSLFDQQTNVTSDAGMSVEMKTFYCDTLIDNAEPELVHDRWAQKRDIPKGKGKEIEFRKYDPLPKALVPLTEGVTPKGKKLNVTAFKATVEQYGDFIEYSDILELTTIDNNLVEATKLLGSQAGRTLDTITREVLNGGTNVQYGEGKVSGRHLLVGGETSGNMYFTVRAVRKAARMRRVRTAPIGRSFTPTVPLTFRTIPIGSARTSTRTPRTSMTTRSARSRASALWRPRKRRFSTPRI